MNTDTMHRNILSLPIAFLFWSATAIFHLPVMAQTERGVSYLPVSDFSAAKYTLAVHEVNFEGVSTRGMQRLSYDQVKGSPFFNDNFQPAEIFMGGQKSLGRYKVKFNLLTQEFHFLGNDNAEYVVPKELAKRIVLYDMVDSMKQSAVFIAGENRFSFNGKQPEGYVQEMNTGNVVLYKVAKRFVVTADSLFGTMKRYYFGTGITYFLGIKGETMPLKKLSEQAVFALLGNSNSLEGWIRKNKISLKNEEGLLAFLEQWNALGKQ